MRIEIPRYVSPYWLFQILTSLPKIEALMLDSTALNIKLIMKNQTVVVQKVYSVELFAWP